MPPDAGGERCLIVNADDFGLTSGINRGIIEAHEHGIVTSASLMVRYPRAADAAEYARAHSRLSLGLHFEVAEWRYEDGAWFAAYEIVDAREAAAVSAELDRQLELFLCLTGRQPTHIDSHQHVHQTEPARSVLLRRAKQLNVPLRGCTPAISYCGSFYGQTGEGQPYPEGISLVALVSLIAATPAGWTELGCHPGYSEGLDSVYASEREQEVEALCAPELRDVLRSSGVQLTSFSRSRS